MIMKRAYRMNIGKKLLYMVFLSILVLFSSFASINDNTQFQIELRIQHDFNRVLTITQYSAETPISEAQDGSKSVSVSLLNNTDSVEICNINYSSNVYGLNKIYLRAYPLILLDDLGEPITDERAGYQLDFNNQTDGWSHTLEIGTSLSGNEMTIPITVPFIFENGIIQTLFRTIGVTAIFTDFEEMSVGSYRADIQIGLEAL